MGMYICRVVVAMAAMAMTMVVVGEVGRTQSCIKLHEPSTRALTGWVQLQGGFNVDQSQSQSHPQSPIPNPQNPQSPIPPIDQSVNGWQPVSRRTGERASASCLRVIYARHWFCDGEFPARLAPSRMRQNSPFRIFPGWKGLQCCTLQSCISPLVHGEPQILIVIFPTLTGHAASQGVSEQLQSAMRPLRDLSES